MTNTPDAHPNDRTDVGTGPAIAPDQPVPIRSVEDFFAFCDATFQRAVAQGTVPASVDGLTTIYVTAIEECRRRGYDALVDRILAAMAPDRVATGRTTVSATSGPESPPAKEDPP
jgi:hypothetical protein